MSLETSRHGGYNSEFHGKYPHGTNIETKTNVEANVVLLSTMDDDEESEESETMPPQFDEFDMWEQQQSVAGGGDCETKETISEFQKMFLDELGNESDVNGAAARALQRFLSSSPLSALKSAAPQSPVVHVVNMSDDDDKAEKDHDLDEFDLWDYQKSSATVPRSEKQQQAISSFQKLFLDELSQQDDINGAAAQSIKKMFAMRSLQTERGSIESAVADTRHVLKDHRKQHVTESFQALYQKEFDKSGDANLAAAEALRKLRRLEHVKSISAADAERKRALQAAKQMLTQEISIDGDVNQAVAAALMRIRKAQTVCA